MKLLLLKRLYIPSMNLCKKKRFELQKLMNFCSHTLVRIRSMQFTLFYLQHQFVGLVSVISVLYTLCVKLFWFGCFASGKWYIVSRKRSPCWKLTLCHCIKLNEISIQRPLFTLFVLFYISRYSSLASLVNQNFHFWFFVRESVKRLQLAYMKR